MQIHYFIVLEVRDLTGSYLAKIKVLVGLLRGFQGESVSIPSPKSGGCLCSLTQGCFLRFQNEQCGTFQSLSLTSLSIVTSLPFFFFFFFLATPMAYGSSQARDRIQATDATYATAAAAMLDPEPTTSKRELCASLL